MKKNRESSWLTGGIIAVPVVLSLILLAAHFLRGGNAVLTTVCLFSPFLLLSKKRWTVRLLQGALLVAGWIWIQTMLTLYNARVALNQPWGRMVVILTCVAVMALASVPLLEIRIRKAASMKTNEAAQPETANG